MEFRRAQHWDPCFFGFFTTHTTPHHTHHTTPHTPHTPHNTNNALITERERGRTALSLVLLGIFIALHRLVRYGTGCLLQAVCYRLFVTGTLTGTWLCYRLSVVTCTWLCYRYSYRHVALLQAFCYTHLALLHAPGSVTSCLLHAPGSVTCTWLCYRLSVTCTWLCYRHFYWHVALLPSLTQPNQT